MHGYAVFSDSVGTSQVILYSETSFFQAISVNQTHNKEKKTTQKPKSNWSKLTRKTHKTQT